MVGPMIQACAWLKMMHLKKSTIWPIHTVKGSIKEGLQDTIKGEISLNIKSKVGEISKLNWWKLNQTRKRIKHEFKLIKDKKDEKIQ